MVIPFVGAKQRHGVHVEDISVSEDAGVDIHAMLGLRVEAELVEMLASTPLKPGGGPIPINFIDDVVLQRSSADAGVDDGVVGKDQGLTMGEKVLARSVVADRVSLALEIMVLAGSAVLPVCDNSTRCSRSSHTH